MRKSSSPRVFPICVRSWQQPTSAGRDATRLDLAALLTAVPHRATERTRSPSVRSAPGGSGRHHGPLAGPAAAHTGSATVVGFVSGFLHPIGGLDHVLAMVAVGMLAALIGGRALWLVPASFLGAMVIGSALGFSLPFVEFGIVASVVVLGAVVALAPRMPVTVAMAGRRIRHVPRPRPRRRDAGGRLGRSLRARLRFATAALHLIGVGVGLASERLAQGAGRAAPRSAAAPSRPSASPSSSSDTLFVIPGARFSESPEPTTGCDGWFRARASRRPE